MNRQILFFVLAFFSFGQSWSQKANFVRLEKLFDPVESEGTFISWKNEEILIPVLFESKSLEEVKVSFSGAQGDVSLYQLHPVWADFSAGNCGDAKSSGTFEKIQVPDRAELREDFSFKPTAAKQLVLLVFKPSAELTSGTHPIQVSFSQQKRKADVKGDLILHNRTLKNLDQLSFYVDYWQFPIAIADYYAIKPWSEAHWMQVDSMFSLLQGINQQSVTVSVFWDLYNTRIRPLEEMMIQVTKRANGNYSYDFSTFDAYVDLAQSHGISRQIAVHNLFPWNGFLFYYDEATAQVQSIQTSPGTDAHVSFWEPFLIAFGDHLEEKGWADKTVLFVDERDSGVTLNLAKWIKGIAPGLKIGYSGDFYPELSEWIVDYSMPVNVVLAPEEMRKRVLSSGKTSLYTSCFEKPNQPNQLLTSDLRDIYFLTQLAKSRGYDGLLHWAFNLWSPQIMDSAIYSDLPSGDSHLVYPDGQVSVRYLVLKDALEELCKFETISKIENPTDMTNAMNRYFLINIEADRYEMVQMMKDYLNE